MVHDIYHLKIVIGIMIVLLVDVVELHLLVEAFLPKGLILFVPIVANERIIQRETTMIMVLHIVLLLVTIIEQIKENFFFFKFALVMINKSRAIFFLSFFLFE